MISELEYRTLANLQDEQQLGALLRACFGSLPPDWYYDRLGRENFRLISKAGQVVGSLAIYSMGQWYGGQCVPMAGIAAVGVAPEHRGNGVAWELMRRTLLELHGAGVPISALYAATQALYRKVGYEQGGSFCRWELPTASIQLCDRSLPMHLVNPVRPEVFQDIYEQKAKANNGNLARHSLIWERVVEPPKEQSVYAYLIGSPTQPEGYVIFTQSREPEGFMITVKDWAVLTAAAGRRFWTFLADHRSQIERVRWCGAPVDPFLVLLPEQMAKIAGKDQWMLRVINVPLALSKRGYPVGIETELHLEVQDNLIPANNGKFCLSVSGGRGEVTKGGKGELQINIHGLASLYTGLLTPIQLQLIGYLKAVPEALSTATLLFSGSEPWMPDFF